MHKQSYHSRSYLHGIDCRYYSVLFDVPLQLPLRLMQKQSYVSRYLFIIYPLNNTLSSSEGINVSSVILFIIYYTVYSIPTLSFLLALLSCLYRVVSFNVYHRKSISLHWGIKHF
uniref:Uncharacterized protein n=1 Tax=Cacopsylla melanoneura TaxID=428564 RepID=A0A8D8TD86_9HEMI